MRFFSFLTVVFILFSTESVMGIEKSLSSRSGNDLRINISFGLDDSLSLTDRLLSVNSNDAVHCAFLIEKHDSGKYYLNYLTHNKYNRFVIDHAGDTCNIVFHFSHQDKTCTLYTESDTTIIADVNIPMSNLVFTVLPALADSSIYNFEINQEQISSGDSSEIKWILLFILFDLGVFLVIHLKNRLKNKEESSSGIVVRHKRYLTPNRVVNSSISLFGKFRIFNKSGVDITSNFSPILKEILFLLISHSEKGGISSERMKEILWLDKSSRSATNNRSVYFNKLRSLMKDVGDFKLISEKGVWRIETSGIVIDYLQFLNITDKGTITKNDIISLLGILENGKFLGEFEAQWADAFKSETSDSVISLLSNYLLGFNIKAEPDFAVQICDVIFNFDSLNEVALDFKCKAYKVKGNHTLAKLTYNNYCKDYLSLYGEEYSKSFSDIFYM